MKRLILVTTAAIALTACNGGNEGDNNSVVANNQATNNQATNNAETAMMLPVELRQLMDENCVSCHTASGIGPYDFTDTDTVVNLADLIVRSVETGVMPPWNQDPTCADLKGDLRLTDEEIAVFSNWLDEGKPLVPEQEYEKPEPKNPEIGDPPAETDEVIDVMIPQAYEPVFGKSDLYQEDDFRCFAVDPGFDTDREMTGFEVLVDNVEVSHHMVVFTADGDEDNRAALEALESEDSDPGFDCFGVSGFNVNGIAAVWAPGGGRVGFPRRQAIGQTAVEVPAESLIVIQMHYNKAAVDAGTDQSGVRMWFRPEDEPINELAEANWTFIGNQPFRIPAGVDGTMVPDEQCDIVYDTFTLDDDQDNPVSPPDYGYHADEVECGIELEDCESENGEGAAECAINYGSRLRVNTADLAATYTVTIDGNEVVYDASAASPADTPALLQGIADAINGDDNVNSMVAATLFDRNSDEVMDEIRIGNLDTVTTIRTEAFTATGETAAVWHSHIDKCAQFEPSRLVEAAGVGSSGCVQMDVFYRNPAPLKLWAAFTHMHLLGERIETEILKSDDDGEFSVPRDEDAECAARTNTWDFDWQRTYWYEEPKDVPRNGLVRLRCRWDNSDSDQEVRLGDGSGSEMCLSLLYLTL